MARIGLFLAILALALAGPAAAGPADQPVVVKIHADWCGTCTRLNPVWKELEAAYGDRSQWVVLDVTDRETLERARAEAQRLGLTDFFQAYKSRTGTIAVFSAGSHEPSRVLKGVVDREAYDAALHEAGLPESS